MDRNRHSPIHIVCFFHEQLNRHQTFYRRLNMIKELVCADCGCEDVKLVTKPVKTRAKTDVSYLIWIIIATIPIFVGIILLILSYSAYVQMKEDTDLANFVENIDNTYKYFHIGLMIFLAGIVLLLMTTLLNVVYGTYETKIRIIAICPHCGKSWTLSMNKNGHLSYYKNSGERSHAMFTREKPDADTEQNADNQKKE